MLALTFLLAVAAQTQSVRPYREPTKARIVGTVLDEGGAPLEGVQVEWQKTNEERGPKLVARARSLGDGRFELAADPEVVLDSWSECVLSVEFPGLAPTWIEGLLPEVKECDLGSIRLYPFAELRGSVVDVQGNAVSGASVFAMPGASRGPSETTWGLRPIATTGADGGFSCRNVPPGLVTLGVSARGFADLVFEPRALALHTPNELAATLQPGRTVVLHVQDDSSGAPLLATCTPLGPVAPYVESDSRIGKAKRAFWRKPDAGDPSGRVVIDALPTPFDGGILVEAAGHAPRTVSLAGGDRSVALRETLPLTVRATRKGSSERPELAALRIRRDTARSVGMCGLSESLHWLGFAADSPAVERLASDHWRVGWNGRHAYAGRQLPGEVIAVLADRSTSRAQVGLAASLLEAEVELEFEPPARLRGRVVLPQGEQRELGLLIAQQLEPTTFRFETDDEGRFDVRLGAGSCWLFPEDQGWTFPTRGHHLELAPGETRDVELTLLPRKLPDLRVRGRVTVAGERPGRPIQLALERETRARLTATTWTDEDGHFELVAPERGSFWIVPRGPEPLATSWRDLRSEFLARSVVAAPQVVVTGEPLAELTLDLPPLEAWQTRSDARR